MLIIQTKDHIAENSEKYTVYFKGKSITYSKSRYGEFAEKLAKLTFETGKRYENFFEDNGDGTTTFYINTHAYGVKQVLVDTEDAQKFHTTKISVAKDNHAYTYYAGTKHGKLHRLIMNVTKSNEVVDHIDRNGLNNTKANLRIVDVSTNNRNANIRSDNKSGYKGLHEEENRFRVFYYDNEMKKCSKSFSKYKYGPEEAKRMALEFRNEVYEMYGYIA